MAINKQFESYNAFFSSVTTSEYNFINNFNDDEVDNMDYDDEEKGPAVRRMFRTRKRTPRNDGDSS